MGSTHFGLDLARSYRSDSPDDSEEADYLGRQLQEASDALAMALLALEGDGSNESRHEKHNRAARARSLLAEAVTALSRAKVFLPRIHTYAVPAVMTSAAGVDNELSRLHQLSSTLTMRNYNFLPRRSVAKPLSPDDEAQLRRVLEGLRMQSKLGRVARYRWLGFTACFGVLAPVFGSAFAALALVCAVVAAWQLGRESSRPALNPGR